MSETNAAPEELLHHLVTIEGTYITRAGEETFSEKFIVPVENAEAALVHVLTRAEDSLKDRLLKLDSTFRGIRTHIVTAIEDVLGVKPAPAPEPEAPADPLAAANAELNAALAKANAQIKELCDEKVAGLAAALALKASLDASEASRATLVDQVAALNEQLASLKADVVAPQAPVDPAPAPAAAPEAPAPQS